MVKLRLKRMGSKFNAFYRIIAADARAPRDGRFIEELGYYNPHTKETFVNKELRSKWEKEGAVASTTVKNLFKKYDKAATQDSKDGVVTLEIKPKKVKKQETKVEEIIAEKASDVVKEASEEKASDAKEELQDNEQEVVTTAEDSTPVASEEKPKLEESVAEDSPSETESKEEVAEETAVETESDETSSKEEQEAEENETDVDEANSEEVASEEK